MKYGLIIFKKMAPEWRETYLDYKVLKILLKPLKILSKSYLNVCLPNQSTIKTPKLKAKLPKYNITNFTKEDIDFLKNFNDKFEYMIWFEFEKINTFFKSKLMEYLVKFRLFKINVSIIQTMKSDKNYKNFYGELKNCFNLYYKEITLLIEFYNVNFEAMRKIIKKQKKLCNSFPKRLPFIPLKIDTYFSDESFIYKNISKLQKLKQDIENIYLEMFYGNEKNIGKIELSKISQGRLISHWENFYFGLFSGFTILLCIIILVMGIKGDLDPDSDDQFNHVFHIYRGLGLFIIYIWLLGWNVYGWTKYHINYKLIFRFNHHYSTLSEILKRAASFTTILLLAFLWYIVFKEKEENDSNFPMNFIKKELCPLLGWIMLVGYIFFPWKKYFNGEGRFFMFNILKRMFLTSCFYVDFTLAWATDQMVSFVIPIRDLEYTFCYYIQRMVNPKNVENCYAQEKITIAFIAAFIPLTLRIIQCLRSMYQKEHRFVFKTDFFNMVKYLLAMTTVFLSLGLNLDTNSHIIFYLWIIFASISTLYSYYWDLKNDWGFLDSNAKNKYLRDQLSYNNPFFYYFAIAINFAFRFAWSLSLSSAVVDRSMRKELFTFLIGFIEITRRSIWNFFRVEKEHITNCGLFRVVENYKLPFENVQYKIDEKRLIIDDFESLDIQRTKSIAYDGKTPLLIDFDELKDKLKKSPMYTFEGIKKEIIEFKNHLSKKNKCFVISEENDASFIGGTTALLKKNSEVGSITQGEYNNDNLIVKEEDSLYDQKNPVEQKKNKLYKSISKYMDSFGNEGDKRKGSCAVNFKEGIEEIDEQNKLYFEVDNFKQE